MISPDAGNMGVKAVYVWAGLLIPTTVILWLYYPEVKHFAYFLIMSCNNKSRLMAEPTSNSMSSTNARSQHGSSRTRLLCRTRADTRTKPSYRNRRGEAPSLPRRSTAAISHHVPARVCGFQHLPWGWEGEGWGALQALVRKRPTIIKPYSALLFQIFCSPWCLSSDVVGIFVCQMQYLGSI